MFERKNSGAQEKSGFRHGKRYNYGFIGAIFIVLVIVLLLNVLLIYNMTVNQIETIGQNQMKSITRNLESMLSQAEYMTSVLADHVEDIENVIVAPTVPYGVCPYHLSFEGSINIGYEGLYMVLHGIMDSLMQHGAKRFVILNGHGGNTPSIDRAALEVYHKGGVCASVDWWSLVAQLDKKFEGGHGDVLETSAMMAIAPESVHLELSKPINAQDPSENMKAAYIQAVNFKGGIVRLVRDTKEIAPSGWFGPFDPKDSSAELGQEALDLAVSYIRDFLEEMKQMKLSV